jgi:hypothetical protein
MNAEITHGRHVGDSVPLSLCRPQKIIIFTVYSKDHNVFARKRIKDEPCLPRTALALRLIGGVAVFRWEWGDERKGGRARGDIETFRCDQQVVPQ